jgi:hypothetical protein
MSISTFDGPVRSLNGFYSQGNGNATTLGATAALTVAANAGKTMLAPATCAVTLPIIVATADGAGTGPGSDPNTLSNIGTSYTIFFNAISAGATAQTITTGTAGDKFVGALFVSGTTTMAFASVTGVTITLNATTTGGAARGSYVTCTAIAANVWEVSGILIGSGTVATPFS